MTEKPQGVTDYYPPPTYEDFLKGLSEPTLLNDKQRELLMIQYGFLNSTATATQLAERLGYEHHAPINTIYARISRAICQRTGFRPSIRRNGETRWWAVLSAGRDCGGGRFEWIMHPQLVMAIESLGWVESAELSEGSALPSQVDAVDFLEGSTISSMLSRYERSPKARATCLAIHGCRCQVCGFDFECFYGEIGAGFIHVHHLEGIAGGRRLTNAKADLLPVCPNCHAMLHRRIPAIQPVVLRDMISRAAGGPDSRER